MKTLPILLLTLFLTLAIVSISPTPTFSQTLTSTESLILKLQEQIQALQQQVTKLQSEVSSTKTELELVKTELKFTKALKLGNRGDEVIQLQEFLKQFPDIYPQGLVTGYFGPLTEIAVRKFQSKQGIESIGVVGPKTLSKLNELITEGAGKSDIIPPGLLIAPGVQKRLEPTATTTIPIIPITPATTTPSVATTTPPVTATTTPSSTTSATPATPSTPATPTSSSNTSTVSATPATPAQPASTATTDTTPPTVTFNIKPMAGFTNAIMVDYVITDNVGVLGYQMKIDGTYLGTEIIQSPPGPINAGGSQTLTNGSHIITMVARDAAGNIATQNITVNIPFGSSTTTSTTATSTTTATTDTTPPSIFNVIVNAAATSATITWTTDELADSQVEYAISGASSRQSPLDTTLTKNHTVIINFLYSSSFYYYLFAKSKDSSGNLKSYYYNGFDTLPLSAPTGLVATLFGANSVEIFWNEVTGVNYKLYRKPTGETAWNLLLDYHLSTRFIDYTVPPGSYDYKVQSCDTASPRRCSIDSNLVSINIAGSGTSASTSTSSIYPRSQNLSAISQMLNSLNNILRQLSQLLK